MSDAKVDLKKQWKAWYAPSAKEVSLVDIPEQQYLMIDGQGNPNKVPEFGQAIEALYATSYTLKFMLKKSSGIDYGVMPLEGLWWAEDMSTFEFGLKDHWQWTLMILQPQWITSTMVQDAISQVVLQKKITKAQELRFELYHEGASAQIMHVGPFATEGPTIQKVHQAIAQQGKERRAMHHEIYLSDMRKADPAKWKTIIRQPYQELTISPT